MARVKAQRRQRAKAAFIPSRFFLPSQSEAATTQLLNKRGYMAAFMYAYENIALRYRWLANVKVVVFGAGMAVVMYRGGERSILSLMVGDGADHVVVQM